MNHLLELPCTHQPLKKSSNGWFEQGLNYGLSSGEINFTLKSVKTGRHTRTAISLKHLVADASFWIRYFKLNLGRKILNTVVKKGGRNFHFQFKSL